MNVDFKQCKNCHLEYSEKENFKWSCKTHSLLHNGDYYWCCGKRDIKAKGCKSSSHQSKEDEEDDEEENKLKELTQAKN